MAAYFDATGLQRRGCARMLVKTATLLMWLAASYLALVFLATTWWQALPLATSVALAMAGVGFCVMHDGNHGAYSPHRWLNKTAALSLNLLALILFINPLTRMNWITLNVGCFATYAGCYIEKGMGLIIPGLTPDTLGEIYEYYPTSTELRVAAGVFAVGFLVFTLMLKVAVPIVLGEAFPGRVLPARER